MVRNNTTISKMKFKSCIERNNYKTLVKNNMKYFNSQFFMYYS